VQRFFDESLFRSRITDLGRKQVYKMIREGTLD
jgi:hypothetical protein